MDRSTISPAGGALLSQGAAAAGAVRQDPFNSGMWETHLEMALESPSDWAFDPAVRLLAPREADDARHLPLMLDATALGPVSKIVVTADYSPFPVVFSFKPGRAAAKLGFGMKIEEATPIRVSAQRPDGSWRVGGEYVRAAGGGCGVPAKAHERPDWQATLGETRARLWPEGRLRLRITHPMDTGLADGAPIFFLTELTVLDRRDDEVASLEIGVPVEENPSFAFDLPTEIATEGARIVARDNMGYEIEHDVPGAAS
ncbi:MAG: quinoprotein dehydrogenase-associated SoxYZ-like carrier [Pseudomonadota bacterium]